MKRLSLIVLVAVLVFSPMASASGTSLIERIAQAQKQLASTEKRISSERQKLARQLHGFEREVLMLREKAVLAQRMADEKTLSLSKLEERLDSWRQQSIYQKNLLHRFLQQYAPSKQVSIQAHIQAHIQTMNTDASARIPTTLATMLATTLAVMDRLEGRFNPRWVPADVVLTSGEVAAMSVLTIGPVNWYWDKAQARAGLASMHDGTENLLHADLLLSSGDSSAIGALREQSQGDIVFDPTLSRALTRQKNSESVLEHIMKGGMWAVPIVLFAIFALTICLVKASQLWRLPKLLRFTPSALRNALADPASPIAANVTGMQQTLLNIARNNDLPRQRDDQLFMQLQDNKHWLERWIGAIAITAAVSPLLGLLGTVSGMIETFRMMTLFGSGDPEVVSGGIAQALVTTELGLVVAIPALILNAVLSRRAKSYYNELESFAILLSKADEAEVVTATVEPIDPKSITSDSPVTQGVTV